MDEHILLQCSNTFQAKGRDVCVLLLPTRIPLIVVSLCASCFYDTCFMTAYKERWHLLLWSYYFMACRKILTSTDAVSIATYKLTYARLVMLYNRLKSWSIFFIQVHELFLQGISWQPHLLQHRQLHIASQHKRLVKTSGSWHIYHNIVSHLCITTKTWQHNFPYMLALISMCRCDSFFLTWWHHKKWLGIAQLVLHIGKNIYSVYML